TIHSVCASCNSNLNKKIDEKFKDHKLISTYRFAFLTNGRGKGIKNPLSGERINIDGTKYNLKLNDDLTVDATMSPKFSKQFSDLKIGDTIEIQIDEKQIGHIEGYKENIAKRLGISIDEIQIQNIDKTFRPESNYILKTDNNIVLLEFSKIFFQTASDLIGEPYLNDPIAAKYRSMLISGKIDESIKEYISPNNQITAEVFLQLLPSAQNCPN